MVSTLRLVVSVYGFKYKYRPAQKYQKAGFWIFGLEAVEHRVELLSAWEGSMIKRPKRDSTIP